jgi:hypothetical protein
MATPEWCAMASPFPTSGELADGETTCKDGLHLSVVHNGLVEELGVLGVVLQRKTIYMCKLVVC